MVVLLSINPLKIKYHSDLITLVWIELIQSKIIVG